MATVNLVITAAGLAEVINAQNNGTAPVILSQVGFGTGQYSPTENQTTLTNEFKRLSTISGGSVGDNIIHVTITDASNDAYTVNEIGVYTSTGTLFAVASQNIPLILKASAAQVQLAVDIVFTAGDPDSITVGDTNFQMHPATTTMQGIVELATDAEVQAGTDGTRAITPKALAARTATTGRIGLVELATAQEGIAGSDGTRAITPQVLTAAFVRQHGESGFQKLPGGFIMQWGRALIAADGTTRIVFPTAFPNACTYADAVSLTEIQLDYSISTKDANGVAFKHNGNGGNNSSWIAIGY